MGYYMRYIITEEKDVSLEKIEQNLKKANAKYSIGDGGELNFGGETYAAIDLTLPKDGLFEEEIEELKEELEELDGKNIKEVLEVLNKAKVIVAVQVLNMVFKPDEDANRLEPLWEWLFGNYEGLLQADAEGYYNEKNQILEF